MKTVGAIFGRKLPGTAVFMGALFLLGAAIYWTLMVHPSYQSFTRARQEIAGKKQMLENKKGLSSVYARAQQMTRQPFDMGLPLPEKVSLPRTNLISITERLSHMAGENHLDILGNTIHINGVTDESRSIAMTIQLTGGLSDFRSYLMDVMALSSYNAMDGLHIYTDKTRTKYYTIDIRLWLEAQAP
ncbi:MAG: hypothetical protein LC657_03530 [Desulfobacteraceae bacterium]|nr:hypothetical protein [Desulfobacteraceae bacterium]